MFKRSRLSTDKFSVQVPVTVMLLGPSKSNAFNAAVMLVKAPGVAPLQSTVALAARAAVGRRKHATASSRPVRADKQIDLLRILSAIFIFFLLRYGEKFNSIRADQLVELNGA